MELKKERLATLAKFKLQTLLTLRTGFEWVGHTAVGFPSLDFGSPLLNEACLNHTFQLAKDIAMVATLWNCVLEFRDESHTCEFEVNQPEIRAKADEYGYIPRLVIFFQFASPMWSSKVSLRDPGPIS